MSSVEAELDHDEIDVEDLFDEDGELRLVEDESGWAGFAQEGDAYFYVDTGVDWKLRCGERAIRLAVQERADHVLNLAHRIRRAAA